MMGNGTNGVNNASNLSTVYSPELREIMGNEISPIVISVIERQLPLNLIMEIQNDINICETISYECEQVVKPGSLSDLAIDGAYKRDVLSRPKFKTFHGFRKTGFEIKIPDEHLECYNKNPFLRQWLSKQIVKMINHGIKAIMSRFYRHLVVHAHPRNRGANAGLQTGGNQLGTLAQPVKFDAKNADKFMQAILNVGKQMPYTDTTVENRFGSFNDEMFIFGPTEMESVFMQVENYFSYNKVGDCANCSLFKSTFDHMPRGILPITGTCIEPYVCENGGQSIVIYPVLFGKRYRGTKAGIRINNQMYAEPKTNSTIYQTAYYWHIHTYDSRYLGLAYITIDVEQPTTVAGCVPNNGGQ